MIEKVLTFYLSGGLFGIDITLVKEINRNLEYTPIPDSADYIVGLFNMRGQIVTIFDLARMMEYEEEEQKAFRKTCIILKSKQNASNQIGFLIDNPGDVIPINMEQFESLPANIGSVDGEYLNGVLKLKNELLMIIDPKKIFKE